MRCIRGPWRDSFPNYEIFDNLDVAYSNFITRLDCVINAIAPFKTVRIKNNASEWFDGEIAEKIHTRDKLYKKFKSTKLHVDEEIYKEARNTVQNLIRKKKKAYFEEKLKENTANPKKLWKTLKQLGLPEKRLPCTDVCLKVEEDLKFEPFTISELFRGEWPSGLRRCDHNRKVLGLNPSRRLGTQPRYEAPGDPRAE